MKIEEIIIKGELLDAEQLAKVTGGTRANVSNINIKDGCTCAAHGDNINSAEKCWCLPESTDSGCGLTPIPGPEGEEHNAA